MLESAVVRIVIKLVRVALPIVALIATRQVIRVMNLDPPVIHVMS